MQFLNQLFSINTRLNKQICGLIIILLSSITLPSLSLAQLPRFDSQPLKQPSPEKPSSTVSPSNTVQTQPSQLPKQPSPEKPSSTVSPSNTVQTQPSQPPKQLIVNDSTAPLPGTRQLPIGIIQPVNGLVNIKLANNTAATISYEIIGDTTQRQLSGKSEVILRKLKVPVNITFYRDKGGFLLIKPQFIVENSLLLLNMTETNNFNLDKSSLLIEETGSVFLN
ncbi:hypothetical protein D5R40_27770 [Okeania hirsuta]|uniref:Uncharacterized protein n=1 Tax=Okeania hirsuta TaxID=1458930 RepID=A0A3N6N8Q1_9CYAN|nr:hypothetical protein D4Z78_25775 [Okeania hirsuta]RQH27432.1 hypothetical protein D5R40_27770 [Okeania hirsuta]